VCHSTNTFGCCSHSTSTKSQLSQIANSTPQLMAHGKPRGTPFDTELSSPCRDTDCGPVNDPFVIRSSRKQSCNNHPQTNEVSELPIAQSRSNTTNAKDLPPAELIPNLSTAQARNLKVARLPATGKQEATNHNRSKAHVTRSERTEGTSVEKKRLPFVREASPHIELPEPLAADTSNITSPSNSSGRSNNPASDTDGAEYSSRPTGAKPPKVRKTVSSSRNKSDASKNKKNQKTKGKPALVTPLEYAQKLQLSFELGKKRKSDHLRGKRIFYVGGDMQYASTNTRGRMDYVSFIFCHRLRRYVNALLGPLWARIYPVMKPFFNAVKGPFCYYGTFVFFPMLNDIFQIVKHGGTLVPSYDRATVTHIVTDATTRPTLRALGLKSLKEIPDHIPTVRWSWVISGYGRSGYNKNKRGEGANTTTKGKAKATEDDDDHESYLDFEFLHAAFPERIDAGRSWLKKGKGKQAPAESQVVTSAGDFSRIS
jgi:DNA polymerase lambda